MMNENSQQRAASPGDVKNVLRGVCMGCADVVPGVSGGTVALILGIYLQLVTAISHVDGTLWRLGRAGKWRAAAEHLDLRFLAALAAGILTGIVGMTLVVNRLLAGPTSRAFTMAAFFGMILASALIVARLIRASTAQQKSVAVVLAIAAALIAVRISLLQPAAGEAPSLLWLFVCGAIGICAMILPGISGAMILLVLGVYEHLTEIPHNLLAGEAVAHSLSVLVVFAAGCGISLVLFSKVLRWLLTHFHTQTMSILCGFMFGALVKLWPFQRDTTPQIVKFKHKVFEHQWPPLDTQSVAIFLVMGAAALFVLFVDRRVRK